jgi:hypothetical protein
MRVAGGSANCSLAWDAFPQAAALADKSGVPECNRDAELGPSIRQKAMAALH